MTYTLLSSSNLKSPKLILSNFITFSISLENVTNITCVLCVKCKIVKLLYPHNSEVFYLQWEKCLVICRSSSSQYSWKVIMKAESCYVVKSAAVFKKSNNLPCPTIPLGRVRVDWGSFSGVAACWTRTSMTEHLGSRSSVSCFILLLRIFILEHLILHIFPSL